MRRLLPANEWHRLREPVKVCFGADKEPPSPHMAECAVEENEAGEIIGFLFLQTVLHMEPFGSLGGASFSGLRAVLDEALALTADPNTVYYLHTDNSIGKKKFLADGFKEMGTLFEGSPSKE